MVKRLLWEGLESGLAMITPLIPTERLDDFRRRIRDNEPAARRAWGDRRQQLSEYARYKFRAAEGRAFRQRPAETLTRPAQQQVEANPRSADVKKAEQAVAPPSKPARGTAPAAGCYTCGGPHYANRCPNKGTNNASNDRPANQVELNEEDSLSDLDIPDSDSESGN